MSPAVFFPPRYFAPLYFLPFPTLATTVLSSIPSTDSVPSTWPTAYFSPAYFTPYYFPSLTLGTGQTPPPVCPVYRDRDAYLAIIEALDATGEFAAVRLGISTEYAVIAADCSPAAIVLPAEWSEVDDADPFTCLRQVTYTLTLLVRAEDAEERLQQLDRLTSIAQNAIDGSNLNGGCLGALTKLRRGRYQSEPRHPEQMITLTGSFAYLINAPYGHDTTR